MTMPIESTADFGMRLSPLISPAQLSTSIRIWLHHGLEPAKSVAAAGGATGQGLMWPPAADRHCRQQPPPRKWHSGASTLLGCRYRRRPVPRRRRRTEAVIRHRPTVSQEAPVVVRNGNLAAWSAPAPETRRPPQSWVSTPPPCGLARIGASGISYGEERQEIQRQLPEKPPPVPPVPSALGLQGPCTGCFGPAGSAHIGHNGMRAAPPRCTARSVPERGHDDMHRDSTAQSAAHSSPAHRAQLARHRALPAPGCRAAPPRTSPRRECDCSRRATAAPMPPAPPTRK